MAEILTLSSIVLSVLVYAAWSLHKAEATDFDLFVNKTAVLEQKIDAAEKRFAAQDELVGNLISASLKAATKNDQLEKDVDALLKAQTSKIPKPSKWTNQSPLPVEIIERPSITLKPRGDVLTKVRKQIKGLSK